MKLGDGTTAGIDWWPRVREWLSSRSRAERFSAVEQIPRGKILARRRGDQ